MVLGLELEKGVLCRWRRPKDTTFTNRRHSDNPPSMEEHEKGKQRGRKGSEETARRKKRRGASLNSYGKDKNAEEKLSLSSESGRRIEDSQLTNRREVSDEIVISNDVLEEIMLKLPVKSLIRFQFVSKQWRRMVKSRSFRERYNMHQRTQEPRFLCLYNNDESNNLTLKTLLEWSPTSTCLVEEGPSHQIGEGGKDVVRVSGSCDGLVCIFDTRSLTNPIIVSNPAMGRSQTLPLSRFQRQYLDKKKKKGPMMFNFPGFGKDNVTGTYKLVWLQNNNTEVFDFEIKEWRYMIDNRPYELTVSSWEIPIYGKGWLYWLTNEKTIHSEMFQVITDRILSQASSVFAIEICSLNDRIWITDIEGDNGIQHFWRIKNELDLEWESDKMFSIDLSLISPWFPYDDSSFPLITLVATSKDDKKVLVSKLGSSELIQLLPHPTSLVFHSVFSGPSHTVFVPYSQSLDFPL